MRERVASEPLPEVLAHCGPGDHLCFVHDREEVRRAALGAFVRAGLDRGDRVLFIAGDRDGFGLPAWLAAAVGSRPARAGQFIVRSARQTYLAGGGFDPDRMIALLRDEVAAAERDGFAALRVTGGVRWAFDDAGDGERLLEYERRVDEVFRDGRALALCHYDHGRIPAAAIADAVGLHRSSLVMLGNRPGAGAGPLLALSSRAAGQIAVSGELDVAGKAGADLICAAVRTHGDLVLDLSGLVFMDAAGVRGLTRAADEAASAGARLTLLSPTAAVERVMRIAGVASLPAVEVRAGQGR